jgi:hypothetical protein
MDKRSSEKPPTRRKSFTNNVNERQTEMPHGLLHWRMNARNKTRKSTSLSLEVCFGYNVGLFFLSLCSGYLLRHLLVEWKGSSACLKIPKCDSKWTGTVVAPCRTYRRCCKGGWKAFTCHSSPRSSQLLSKLL